MSKALTCVQGLDKTSLEFVDVKKQTFKSLLFALIPRPSDNKSKVTTIDMFNKIFNEVSKKQFGSIVFPATVDINQMIQCLKDQLCRKSSHQMLKTVIIMMENDYDLNNLKTAMDKKCKDWNMAGNVQNT